MHLEQELEHSEFSNKAYKLQKRALRRDLERDMERDLKRDLQRDLQRDLGRTLRRAVRHALRRAFGRVFMDGFLWTRVKSCRTCINRVRRKSRSLSLWS